MVAKGAQTAFISVPARLARIPRETCSQKIVGHILEDFQRLHEFAPKKAFTHDFIFERRMTRCNCKRCSFL